MPSGTKVELHGNHFGWWRNARGEYYVAAQVLLLALVAIGPRFGAGPWSGPWAAAAAGAGGLIGSGGLVLVLGGLWSLGLRNLSPLPHPKHGATLVEGGVYRLVRHPIYGGVSLAALGWGLAWRSPVTLGLAVLLFALLDLKSRREEHWLSRTYPQYADYRRRVKRLIPLIY